jgi:hypothetical protein
MAKAKDLGITIHAAYVCAPAHTVFYVVETEGMENIHKWFDPMLEYGTATFHPVLDLAAAQKLLAPEPPKGEIPSAARR